MQLSDKYKILFFSKWLSLAAKHSVDVESRSSMHCMFVPTEDPLVRVLNERVCQMSCKPESSVVNLQFKGGSHHINVLQQDSCHLLNLFCHQESYSNVLAIYSN